MAIPRYNPPRRFPTGPVIPRRPGPYDVVPPGEDEQRQIRHQGLMTLGASLLSGINPGTPGGFDFSALGHGISSTQQVMQALTDQITERNTQKAIWDYQVEEDEEQKRRQTEQDARAKAEEGRRAEKHKIDIREAKTKLKDYESPAKKASRERSEGINRIRDFVGAQVKAGEMSAQEASGYLSSAEIDWKKTHTDILGDADRAKAAAAKTTEGTLTERDRVGKATYVESRVRSPSFLNLPDSDPRKQRGLELQGMIARGHDVMVETAFDFFNDPEIWPVIGRGSLEEPFTSPVLAEFQDREIKKAGEQATASALRSKVKELWTIDHPEKDLLGEDEFNKNYSKILEEYYGHPEMQETIIQAQKAGTDAAQQASLRFRQNNLSTRIAQSAEGQDIRSKLQLDPAGFDVATTTIHSDLFSGRPPTSTEGFVNQLFPQHAQQVLEGVPPDVQEQLIQLVSTASEGIQPDLSMVPPEFLGAYAQLEQLRTQLGLQFSRLVDQIRGNMLEPLYP